VFARQKARWQFELQLHEADPGKKMVEAEMKRAQIEKILEDQEGFEIDSMREGFRNLLSAKFRNEWRAVK